MISESANDVRIEKAISGNPNQGKVLVAVCANMVDIPIHASGTCAKLMKEGYEGYLVRINNDELHGEGSIFQNIHNNEMETAKAAKALGFHETLNLYYQNHHVHGRPLTDLIMRLVFILRMLKADTVIAVKPSDFDASPEKEVAFNAVRVAVVLSGNPNYYAEHLDAGVVVHCVGQLYFAVGVNDPSFNRIVDISTTVEQKIDSMVECTTHGIGKKGSLLKKKLASEGKRLPVLGEDDRTANREYIRHFILDSDRQIGKSNGLEYAETFCYIDREETDEAQKLGAHIEENAVAI